MFNPDCKNAFIESLRLKGRNDGYITSYIQKLEKAGDTESLLNKDIFDFTHEECEDLLYSYNSSTSGSIRSIRSMLNNYMSYCIETGKTTNFNWFATIKNVDKFVNKFISENKYITEDQLYHYLDSLVNAQDAVKLLLLFMMKTEEAINLKIEDVLPDKILIRKNNVITREIKIDDKIYQLIQDAINQTDYILENGNSQSITKYIIHPTQYVVRISKSNNDIVPEPSFKATFIRIKKFINNKNLTPTIMLQSGMLNYAKKMGKNKTDFTKQDWEYINKYFGASYEWFKVKYILIDHL